VVGVEISPPPAVTSSPPTTPAISIPSSSAGRCRGRSRSSRAKPSGNPASRPGGSTASASFPWTATAAQMSAQSSACSPRSSRRKRLSCFPRARVRPTVSSKAPSPGVGLFACRTQVAVVPARLFGSFEAFDRKGAIRLGTPVTVVFRPTHPRLDLRRSCRRQGTLPNRQRAHHGEDRRIAATAGDSDLRTVPAQHTRAA